MVHKLELECKALIPAQAGTLALFENGEPAKVQLWALNADGIVMGLGVYQGNLMALDLVPGFAGFR
jgi:hypothetical protein